MDNRADLGNIVYVFNVQVHMIHRFAEKCNTKKSWTQTQPNQANYCGGLSNTSEGGGVESGQKKGTDNKHQHSNRLKQGIFEGSSSSTRTKIDIIIGTVSFLLLCDQDVMLKCIEINNNKAK